MNHHVTPFPLQLSIILPFVAIVLSMSVGAVHPVELVRHIGWAAGLIAMSVLFVSLARLLWIGLTDFRVQQMAYIASQQIASIEAETIDDEWRHFNG